MSKKLNWLDKFAEEQAKKQMQKQASKNVVANQIIVSPEDVPNAEEGSTIQFNGENFKVVDANYSDEIGAGVVLEKSAAASDGAYSGLENDPMGLSMGAPESSVQTPSSQGQTYFRTKLPIEETFNNDQDAQFGQSSAQATAQEIAGEDATDRTNVPGHYTKSPGLNTTQDNGASIPVDPNAQVIGYPPVGPGQGSGSVQVQPGYQPQGVPAATPFAGGQVGGDADVAIDPQATVEGFGTEVAPAAPVAEEAPTEEAPIDAPAEDGEEKEKEKEDKENPILAKVKKSLPKKASTTKTATNARIINLASEVSDAIVAEVEDVLEDGEETVAALVPSRLTAFALELLEKELDEEGIEAMFNKAIKIKRTAGEEKDCCDEKDVKEVVKKVAEVIVAELEDVLEDADDEMDKERKLMAEEDGEESEIEAKLKSMVERKLHAKGIYTRFARTAKAAPKKTVAQKIRDARNKRR